MTARCRLARGFRRSDQSSAQHVAIYTIPYGNDVGVMSNGRQCIQSAENRQPQQISAGQRRVIVKIPYWHQPSPYCLHSQQDVCNNLSVTTSTKNEYTHMGTLQRFGRHVGYG